MKAPLHSLVLLVLLAAPLRGEDLLRESLAALYRGETMTALSLAERFIQSNPGSSEGRVHLAQAKLAMRDYDGAYQELSQALEIDPRSIEAHYHFGKLCAILAELEYRSLFAMAPNHYRVHQLQAQSYLVQQDPIRAEEAYQKALKANPRSVSVLAALGDLKRTGSALTQDSARFEEALDYYSRALDIDPFDFDALYGSGVVHITRGDLKRAVDALEKAARVEPTAATARMALGRALLDSGRAEQAIGELMRAAELEPEMRQAYFLLGRAYRAVGKPDLARLAFAKEREIRRLEFEREQKALFVGEETQEQGRK